MADNVQITAGSGTVVSTEEVTTLNGGAVTAQQLQRILLAIRTADGTAIDIPGDATNGIDVDARLKAVVETALSGITVDADGDVARLYCADDGVLYTRSIPAHPADYINENTTTITSSTSDTSIASAGGSGVRVYLTGVFIANKSATATHVLIKDGSGGSTKVVLPAAANEGGAVAYFNPPLRGSANTAWHAACAHSVDSVYITPIGYKSKV